MQDAERNNTTANLWNTTSKAKWQAGDTVLLKDVTMVYDKFAKTNILDVNRYDQIYMRTQFLRRLSQKIMIFHI